jgi:hypothetical protein
MASELPQETVDFAHRMFDAAREGNAELLLAAIDAGLPPNLANPKGTSSPITYHTSLYWFRNASQTKLNHIFF